MLLRLRKTARRGRSGEPERRSLIRSCRFWRAAPRLATCVVVLIPSSKTQADVSSAARSQSGSLLAADLAGLAGLATDDPADVMDALALVRLRLSLGPDLGSNLADQLLVDPDDRHLDGRLEFEADPGRRDHLDLVAVAEAQLQLVPHLHGSGAAGRGLRGLPGPRRHP